MQWNKVDISFFLCSAAHSSLKAPLYWQCIHYLWWLIRRSSWDCATKSKGHKVSKYLVIALVTKPSILRFVGYSTDTSFKKTWQIHISRMVAACYFWLMKRHYLFLIYFFMRNMFQNYRGLEGGQCFVFASFLFWKPISQMYSHHSPECVMHLEIVFLFFFLFFLILIIIFVQRLELNVCSFHLESLVSMPHENTRGQHTEGHAVVKTHYVLRHQ